MKRSRFSDEKIIGILKEHQAGLSAADFCRKYGVSDATFYKWRSKFGGMEVPEAKRLRHLRKKTATVVDNSISGTRVSRELDRIVEHRGIPCMVVSDNGTELTSNAFLKWPQERRVERHYIASGGQNQNRANL